jgi:hypothetical protein
MTVAFDVRFLFATCMFFGSVRHLTGEQANRIHKTPSNQLIPVCLPVRHLIGEQRQTVQFASSPHSYRSGVTANTPIWRTVNQGREAPRATANHERVACELAIAKQRSGSTGIIRLSFSKQYTRFDEATL